MGSSNSTNMKNTTVNNVTNNFMQSIDTEVRNENSAELLASQKLGCISPFNATGMVVILRLDKINLVL